jgi:hypothetical protein
VKFELPEQCAGDQLKWRVTRKIVIDWKDNEERILGSHPQALARFKQAFSRFETDTTSPTRPTKTKAVPTRRTCARGPNSPDSPA